TYPGLWLIKSHLGVEEVERSDFIRARVYTSHSAKAEYMSAIQPILPSIDYFILAIRLGCSGLMILDTKKDGKMPQRKMRYPKWEEEHLPLSLGTNQLV